MMKIYFEVVALPDNNGRLAKRRSIEFYKSGGWCIPHSYAYSCITKQIQLQIWLHWWLDEVLIPYNSFNFALYLKQSTMLFVCLNVATIYEKIKFALNSPNGSPLHHLSSHMFISPLKEFMWRISQYVFDVVNNDLDQIIVVLSQVSSLILYLKCYWKQY